MFFIAIGTGIAGGLATAGVVEDGATGLSGEVGHLVVRPGGARCGCGNYGCLETVASASAIVGAVARAVLTGQSPLLREQCDGRVDTLTAAMVSAAADAGDPFALAAFERAGSAIGMAASRSTASASTASMTSRRQRRSWPSESTSLVTS